MIFEMIFEKYIIFIICYKKNKKELVIYINI